MERTTRAWLIIVSCIVLAGVGFGVFVWSNTRFTPTPPDKLVFVNDFRKASGVGCKVDDLVSTTETGSVRYRDIIVLGPGGNPTMTRTALERYGSDQKAPDGVGLDMTFRGIDGGSTTDENIVLPSWETSPALAGDDFAVEKAVKKAPLFEAAAQRLCAEDRSLQVTIGLAVDVTSGMNARVRERIKPVVSKLGFETLLARKHNVTGGFYRIQELASQANRRLVTTLADIRQATDWILSDQPGQPHSSVLKGIARILGELSAMPSPEAHIVSDFLENSIFLSTYSNSLDKVRAALSPENWANLDKGWLVGLDGQYKLELKGMHVYLYRMPAQNAIEEEKTDLMIDYLTDRLTKAGAVVHVDSI